MDPTLKDAAENIAAQIKEHLAGERHHVEVARILEEWAWQLDSHVCNNLGIRDLVYRSLALSDALKLAAQTLRNHKK